jgi:hypothetical protein
MEFGRSLHGSWGYARGGRGAHARRPDASREGGGRSSRGAWRRLARGWEQEVSLAGDGENAPISAASFRIATRLAPLEVTIGGEEIEV